MRRNFPQLPASGRHSPRDSGRRDQGFPLGTNVRGSDAEILAEICRGLLAIKYVNTIANDALDSQIPARHVI
jgi:hypothetical protein